MRAARNKLPRQLLPFDLRISYSKSENNARILCKTDFFSEMLTKMQLIAFASAYGNKRVTPS